PFELLLTDIVMPEMDGIELARRAAELDPDMKNMFITGFAAGAPQTAFPPPPPGQGASKPLPLPAPFQAGGQKLAGVIALFAMPGFLTIRAGRGPGLPRQWRDNWRTHT